MYGEMKRETYWSELWMYFVRIDSDEINSKRGTRL
jgi:hypothetical protein